MTGSDGIFPVQSTSPTSRQYMIERQVAREESMTTILTPIFVSQEHVSFGKCWNLLMQMHWYISRKYSNKTKQNIQNQKFRQMDFFGVIIDFGLTYSLRAMTDGNGISQLTALTAISG